MKWILYPLVLMIIFLVSCGTEDKVELVAYNPQVFAFDLGREFEVNASVRIKGFEIKGESEEFTSTIGYELDLIKPGGVKEEAFFSKIEDFSFSEKVNDTAIEIQFTLDSTFSHGEYTLVFNLKDNFSGKTASTSAGFKLE